MILFQINRRYSRCDGQRRTTSHRATVVVGVRRHFADVMPRPRPLDDVMPRPRPLDDVMPRPRSLDDVMPRPRPLAASDESRRSDDVMANSLVLVASSETRAIPNQLFLLASVANCFADVILNKRFLVESNVRRRFTNATFKPRPIVDNNA